jgi:hypothetical protein
MTKIHQCQCPICSQPGDHPDKVLHHQMNVLLSRLDEQQRRWYVALEANKLGHGGMAQMSEITGLHPETIRRGQRELAQDLVERPRDRVRRPGGGRPATEKKSR